MSEMTVKALLDQWPQVTRAQAMTRKIRACEGEAAAQLVLERFVLDAIEVVQLAERERCARVCRALNAATYGFERGPDCAAAILGDPEEVAAAIGARSESALKAG